MKVIQTFETSELAYLAVSFLENAGIEAFVWDQNSAGLYPLFNPSIGMVRLVVDESVSEAATEVLADYLTVE